ncbi:MAG: hypothetical protein LBP56_03425, partial [Odoribacteraceae bacterium]|nr:hypothetical protein [Odoribacteraceae bacterium]
MRKSNLNKLKWPRRVIVILFLAGVLLPASAAGQPLEKTYARETLATRLQNLSRDYRVNIGYLPGECQVEVPGLALKG